MAGCGVATPALIGAPVDPAGIGQGLLFEYLEDAHPVTDCDGEAVDQIAAVLGKLHASGVWQSDLHLNNFVKDSAGKVYAIDGDGIRGLRNFRHRSLSERASFKNLALLLAQLPPSADVRLRMPLESYAAARGRSALPLMRMHTLTRRQRCLRARRYLKKTQRTCTEFHYERDLRSLVICERTHWGEAMEVFVADPEKVFTGADVLKAGNSATVVRGTIGQHTYVIKRYNVKNLWHGIRRALKPRSRFRLAWCNGHRLALLRIPTARPVALVERRLGVLRGVAYLVMKDLGDHNLLTEVTENGPSETVVAEVTELFLALQAAELTHGDMKATNFLLAEGGVRLIDLDCMRQGGAGLGRDIRRFLANWDNQAQVQEPFRRAFAAAGLLGAG